MVTIIEPNWITSLAQLIAVVGLIASFWVAWKQYKYQKMESVEKADIRIKQNNRIIELLEKIEGGIKK